jgi:phenylpropionate dioxygenase-like ring-hydroxylating dioxygenase large terminal subunit
VDRQQQGAQAWFQRWYPVAYLQDLDPAKPTAFTLLEQDLVLWFDRKESRWRAFADVCPHRLVPLSEGRLNGAGELECPYHGWSFNGAGHCTAIPQAEPGVAPSPRRSSCLRYATAEAQGLLFVFAGQADQAASQPLPLVPVLAEQAPEAAKTGRWTVQDTFRDLPMDALTVLENVLDPSHVPFTHHASVGRRETAGPVRLELTSFGPEGFTGLWAEGPRRGKLGAQQTVFQAPCLMWHDLTAKGFARILTVVYATPMRRGECRLFARFPFQFESPLPGRLLKLRPQWLQHLANHTVLEDDQVFLHWQERVLEGRGGSAALTRSCFLATGADLYVKALHDWLNRYAGAPFASQRLPERLERRPLLDRYDSHTRHCRSCRGALKRLRWLQQGCGLAVLVALGAAAWLGASPAAALCLLVAALATALGLKARAWIGALHQGDGHPPRNRLARG